MPLPSRIASSLTIIHQSPSGVRIPPNMSKLLLRWNLGPEFKRKLGKKVPDILLHSGELFVYRIS